MSGLFDFRVANSSDAVEIINLYQSYRLDNWKPQPYFYETIENELCVVAEAEKEIVGFAYLFHFGPDIYELANIFVRKDFRNNDVGSSILRLLEKQAKNHDISALLLESSSLYETADLKVVATRFYERNGYREIAATDDSKVFFKKL